MFLSVTISHILKNENYELCFLAGSFVDQITTGKKVQLFGRWLECLGVPSARIVLAASLIKLRPEKRYSRLAIGCNAWGVGSMSLDYFGGFVTMFFGGFLDQITNYDGEKKVQLSGHWLECLVRTFDFLNPSR